MLGFTRPQGKELEVNDIQRSPAPPGAFVEVAVENIDEGAFLREMNAAFRKALADLFAYEGDTGQRGTCAVNAVVTFGHVKGTDGIMQIATKISTKVPSAQRASVAIERHGKVLCQPIGTNDAPEQQTFFDAAGRIIDFHGRPQVLDADSIKLPKAANG